ncbi:hypothetical protein H8S90_09540 [Olivibacter sp. SDN3]|uniref:hypothetical protein n=1 Tax=Olivibacter sp. SDN3 TaxID=2764720 RepID=UPI001650E270|nr:hypothetical protein [Olivibacter sp. SDN3]QNL51791.1 hypothetical protein H8S90_09540 [Olivibacter sp. SDN3]
MSLAKYLIKSFGQEFYKINAGFLIVSFILIIGYGLFIKTAGHIPTGQERTIYLILLLSFVQSPIITLMASSLWLIYTLKCWSYVWKASCLEEHTFWRYSTNALPISKQFTAWCLFQLYLFVPLVIYWLLATIYGLIVGNLMIPLLTCLYLVVLVIFSALIYLYRFNFSKFKKEYRFNLMDLVRELPKTPFNAFFYEIFLKQKTPFFITKILSFTALFILLSSISEIDEPLRLTAIIAITLVASHCILIYLEYKFSLNHLYFIQQLPYSRIRVYAQLMLSYFVLLLPEYLWIYLMFPISVVLLFAPLSLTGMLLIRSILYFKSAAMRPFLKMTFIWFSMTLTLILFDLAWALILINLASSFACFYLMFYKRSHLAIK